MATVRSRPSGFSLVEMMVGLSIGSVVLVGLLSVIGQLTQFENDTRIASLLNQTYFQGVQTARSSVRFKQLTKGYGSELQSCLASQGTNCRSLQTAPVDLPANAIIGGATFNDNTLNGSFGFYGPCAATEAHCLVRRTTKYAWECPTDTYCSGARIDVRAEMLPNAANKLRQPLKARAGSFVQSARLFEDKGGIKLSCASKGTPLITGIDYAAAANQDQCSAFKTDPSCGMPMKTYASGANCQNPQGQPCAQGFAVVGLYTNQQNCVGTVDVSSTVTIAAPAAPTCPNGGVMVSGACRYAVRFCPLWDTNPGHTKGFIATDPGNVQPGGCTLAGQGDVAPGTVVTMSGGYAKCTQGPAADYPLPNNPYCPVTADPNPGGTWALFNSPLGQPDASTCQNLGYSFYVGQPCSPKPQTCIRWIGAGNGGAPQYWVCK